MTPLDLALEVLDGLLLRLDDPAAEEKRAAELAAALRTLEEAAALDATGKLLGAVDVVRGHLVTVSHRVAFPVVRGAARRARRWSGTTSSVERLSTLVAAARSALMAIEGRTTWDALAAGIVTARRQLDEVAKLLEG